MPHPVEFEQDKSRTPFDWRDDPLPGDTIFKPCPGRAPDQVLDWLFLRLTQSPTFLAMLDTTPALTTIRTVVDGTLDTPGAYFWTGHIRVDPYREIFYNTLFTLAHEYRHAWQDQHGLILKAEKTAFKYAILHTRAQEADANVFAFTVIQDLIKADILKLAFLDKAFFVDRIMRQLDAAWNIALRLDKDADRSGMAQNAMFLTQLATLDHRNMYYDWRLVKRMYIEGARRAFQQSADEQQKFRKPLTETLLKAMEGFGRMPFRSSEGLVERSAYIADLSPRTLIDAPALNRISVVHQAVHDVKWMKSFVLGR